MLACCPCNGVCADFVPLTCRGERDHASLREVRRFCPRQYRNHDLGTDTNASSLALVCRFGRVDRIDMKTGESTAWLVGRATSALEQMAGVGPHGVGPHGAIRYIVHGPRYSLASSSYLNISMASASSQPTLVTVCTTA